MTKIVSILKPFTVQQSLYVYVDGEEIISTTCTIDDLNNTVFNLVNQYNVEQIDFAGPKNYALGIADKLQQYELSKYSQNKLVINII